MRIALIAPEKLPVPPIGGGPVEIAIHELAQRLQERHQVTVFCPNAAGLLERESSDRLRYCRLPHQSTDQYLAALMEQLTVDVFELVHIFDRPQFVLSLAPRLASTKIVLHLYQDLLTKEINGAEAAACVDQISAAVTSSYFLRFHTALSIPDFYAKSHVIRPGVDLNQYLPILERDAEQTLRRQQLRLAGKRVILYVGSISSVQGLHILLQAVRPIMRQDPGLVLMVTSESWYADPTVTPYGRELAQLAQSFKRQIYFTGSLSLAELPAVYQLADMLVYPSQWEELQHRSILDAMASGLPIVASARGAIPEMVRHGRNGILVHKHTESTGYTKAMGFLLANPGIAAELGRQGRQMVERKYRWEQAVAELERIHEQVMVGQ